jgi:ABC-type cobalamin/Fe3+-siderophores transport system ATPase subunit
MTGEPAAASSMTAGLAPGAPAPATEPLVAARGVTWRAAGRDILGPLDLAVRGGECLAVVGPNGAGKTTLLRLLAGLAQPAAGSLAFGGQPFARLSRRDLARRIAYVPQIRPARVPLSVEEVVLLGRYPYLSALQLAPRPADFAAVEEALRRVGIVELRQRPVDELSGGERQAVFVAAALAQEAPLLVLDEPTLHLDARHQQELAALLQRLGAEGARTTVLATHDLNLAALLADRVLALDGGRVLALGTPAEVLRPELLERLFRARFEVVRAGDRPVTVLDLAS